MKKTKNQPIEIVLFNLLGKSTLALIKKIGAPDERARQRSTFNYIYYPKKEQVTSLVDIQVKIVGNKVKGFTLKRLYKSDKQCSSYMARRWSALRRGGYNPRKYYGKLKAKKNGKRLDINFTKSDDSYYDVVVIGYLT